MNAQPIMRIQILIGNNMKVYRLPNTKNITTRERKLFYRFNRKVNRQNRAIVRKRLMFQKLYPNGIPI